MTWSQRKPALPAPRRASRVPAILVSAIVAAAAAADDWPQWRGPNRNGLSAETSWSAQWPRRGPRVLWSAGVGAGYSSVSVAGERAVAHGFSQGLVGGRDVVRCLDARTGLTLWEQAYESKAGSYPGPRSAPAIDGDRVYALSRHGDLFCLGLTNGAVRWRQQVRQSFGIRPEPSAWGLSSSPCVRGDVLLLDLGRVLVLDKQSGALVAALGDDRPAFSSAVVFERNGRSCVTTFHAAGLAVYDLEARTEIARVPWETKYLCNVADPVVVGSQGLFLSTGYGRGCSLLRWTDKGLETAYENANLSTDCSTAVLYEGHLYGLSGNQGQKGALKCLDPAAGAVKWETPCPDVGAGPVVAGGRLLYVQGNGTLVVADATPTGYRELARARVLDETCWTGPVLAHGRIYVRGNKGTLVCLDVRPGGGP